MTTRQTQASETGGRGNAGVVVACVAVVAGMAGLAYASVPLYQLFCQLTGYGGTTQRVAGYEDIPVIDREATIRFDANSAPGLGWNFKPAQRSVSVRLGEITQVSYVIENETKEELHGSATFNVTPQSVGAYFNKIECFCFTETVVRPGETLEMPVVFYIDPEMAGDEDAGGVNTITLSYTFFPAGKEDKPVANRAGDERGIRAGG